MSHGMLCTRSKSHPPELPELPEVETVARQLRPRLIGRRITSLVVTGARTVRRQAPEQLMSAAQGREIRTIRRKGKFLVLDLDERSSIVVHLRMSGQLRWTDDRSSPLMRHTHALVELDDEAVVRFVDPRTFGEMWITTSDLPELGHLGPDALDDLSSAYDLRERLSNRRSHLKALLMNQRVAAGIGNIYSDEILWSARLAPFRLPASLSSQALNRLHAAIGEVLSDAIERRGSSLADEQYVDIFGSMGRAQEAHAVYGRAGSPCLRCGTTLERLTMPAGRASYACRRCQR